MARTWLGQRGRRVPGNGPLGAPIVVLGEAPGREEEELGAPFVGASGRFLWKVLAQEGVRREDVRVENVLEVRPEGNELWRVPPHQIAQAQADWWERRAPQLTGARVIVPMGNLALNTLRRAPLPLCVSGKRKGWWRMTRTATGVSINWRDKIGSWRGSITRTWFDSDVWCKVIPTYHPAFILRAGDAWDVWQGDLRRVVADAAFPALRRWPRPSHLIDPTRRQFLDFLQQVHAAKPEDVLALDIETRPAASRARIRCVGACLDPGQTIVLDPLRHWSWLILLLRNRVRKAWHFGLFDRYTLAAACGLETFNSWWDTHTMHHLLDPRDEHRLAYCASRDLRVAYWKDEAKEEGGTSGSQKDERKLKRYCGKDVAYTRALVDVYQERLRERGLLEIYDTHYRQLADACLALSLTGFAVDERARQSMAKRQEWQLMQYRQELTALMGRDPVAKRGLSSPVVASYFYDTLKCKPFYRRGTGSRTCDELSLRRLMHRYKKARPGATLILSYRAAKKQHEAVAPELVSGDGRMRSLYTPTTKTGRLQSGATPLGDGAPMQNRARGALRNMFVADPGTVLLEVDESLAEDRIVNGMSGDLRLLAAARERPEEGVDRHLWNASRIFDVPYLELQAAYQAGDPEAARKRQLGKKARHMLNYDGEGLRMSEVVLVESEGTLMLDPEECQAWIDRLRAAEPGVLAYHRWVQQDVIAETPLRNSWGRTLEFKGLRVGKEDYKEAYAWYPQSEVACLMNQEGFLFAQARIRAMHPGWWRVRIVQQGHDSLVLCVLPEQAWRVARQLVRRLGRERTYPGAGGPWTLSMPIGVKVGVRWGSMREWKGLPERAVFERAVQEVLDGAQDDRAGAERAAGRPAGPA